MNAHKLLLNGRMRIHVAGNHLELDWGTQVSSKMVLVMGTIFELIGELISIQKRIPQWGTIFLTSCEEQWAQGKSKMQVPTLGNQMKGMHLPLAKRCLYKNKTYGKCL